MMRIERIYRSDSPAEVLQFLRLILLKLVTLTTNLHSIISELQRFSFIVQSSTTPSIFPATPTWLAILERWFQLMKMNYQEQINSVHLALHSRLYTQFQYPLLFLTPTNYQTLKTLILCRSDLQTP